MALLRVFLIAAVTSLLPLSQAQAAQKTMAVWSDGHTSELSDEELIRYALASPGPPFPEEAQKKKLSGSGLYELRINKAGTPTDVAVLKSSGSAVLDNAATATFKKWRFKPAIFRTIRVPVSWSVNRVR